MGTKLHLRYFVTCRLSSKCKIVVGLLTDSIIHLSAALSQLSVGL